MSLHDTVSAERVHIGFFGLRNAGKSSLVNAVTGQDLALVSPVKGTTTDPVRKAMELLPLGPVVIIDTPGLDDEGELGKMRVQRAQDVLRETDAAVLVTDGTKPLCETETDLLALFRQKDIPYILARNKSDLGLLPCDEAHSIAVSAKTGENVDLLKETLARIAKERVREKPLVSDLVGAGELAVLVTPIDASAPKGRMILPQQQVMRDLLDHGAVFMTCQPETLPRTLSALREKPRLVITDSQAFGRVDRDTPRDIPLTSFSILFARYKGNLARLVEGAKRLSALQTGDRVLISEGCTHHRQCGDIGTEKIPAWVRRFTGTEPEFSFTSGREFPHDLSAYRLIIHCGGCMLGETEMQSRIAEAVSAGVPVVNYGAAIAHMHGVLRRSLEPFGKEFDV